MQSNGNMVMRHDKVDQSEIVKFIAELLEKLVAFRQARKKGATLKVWFFQKKNFLDFFFATNFASRTKKTSRGWPISTSKTLCNCIISNSVQNKAVFILGSFAYGLFFAWAQWRYRFCFVVEKRRFLYRLHWICTGARINEMKCERTVALRLSGSIFRPKARLRKRADNVSPFIMVALETPRFHSDSTRYPWCEKTNIYKRDIRNCSQAGFLSNTPMVECINRVRFWLVASVAPNTRDTLLYHCARHLENGLKLGNYRKLTF